MHDTYSFKMFITYIVIFLALLIVTYLGNLARSPEKLGGKIGTIVVFSLTGFVLMFVMSGVLELGESLKIWTDGGDTNAGPLLTPILATPLYWIAAFIGMSLSKKNG